MDVGKRVAERVRSALDDRVLGQETARQQVVQLLDRHVLLSGDPAAGKAVQNALILGPTGVGKTHTIKTGCEAVGLPFVSVDCSSLVPSGIVGPAIEDFLEDLVTDARQRLRTTDPAVSRMIAEAGRSETSDAEEVAVVRRRSHDDDLEDEATEADALELAAVGIVFLDEFDKLKQAEGSSAHQLQVQRRLLRIVEGSVVDLSTTRPSYGRRAPRPVDTSRMLFVAAGAFQGIDATAVKRKRSHQLTRLGWNPKFIPNDVAAYGILPELVARFPLFISFDALTTDELAGVLKSPAVSPLIGWRLYFEKAFDSELIVEPDAIGAISELASALEIGARGLEQIVFPVLSRAAGSLTDEQTGGVVRITKAEVLQEGRF